MQLNDFEMHFPFPRRSFLAGETLLGETFAVHIITSISN